MHCKDKSVPCPATAKINHSNDNMVCSKSSLPELRLLNWSVLHKAAKLLRRSKPLETRCQGSEPKFLQVLSSIINTGKGCGILKKSVNMHLFNDWPSHKHRHSLCSSAWVSGNRFWVIYLCVCCWVHLLVPKTEKVPALIGMEIATKGLQQIIGHVCRDLVVADLYNFTLLQIAHPPQNLEKSKWVLLCGKHP